MAGERIRLSGLPNTRDLGGYRTKDGKAVKAKRLLRSGGLFDATAEDIRILTKQYDLKTVVDFRTLTERKQKPDPEIEGVTHVVNEILHEAQMGITHEGERKQLEHVEAMIKMCREVGDEAEAYLGGLYPMLVTNENCIEGYRRFFERVLAQKEGALLYHCSEGKDRVGTATALLFSAFDVERDVILADYELTNKYTEAKRRHVYELMKERLPEEPELAESFLILNSVHVSYMEALFDTLDKVYGGVDNFLREKLGLDEEKLQSLKDNYLEKNHLE